MEISKTQMELANKMLELIAAELNDVALFRGIPATAFDKEHVVMLCNLFADEHYKVQQQHFAALEKHFPSYIAGGCATANLIQKLREAHKKTEWKKPLTLSTIWRRIWNRIKS